MARCLEGLAELALARGDADGCLRFARELLLLAESAGVKELAGVARRWCGEALTAQGEHASASEHLSLAFRVAAETGRVRLAWDVEGALRSSSMARGDRNGAVAHATQAEGIAARIQKSLEGTPLEFKTSV
jgi:hypothetical protein